jgi:hypothetical protein
VHIVHPTTKESRGAVVADNNSNTSPEQRKLRRELQKELWAGLDIGEESTGRTLESLQRVRRLLAQIKGEDASGIALRHAAELSLLLRENDLEWGVPYVPETR